MTQPPTVDELLAQAWASLERVTPQEAQAAVAAGALIVDTRPAGHREREGSIPGALPIERNVLEWRLDPAGPHHVPEIAAHDQVVIVVCDEGFASSLAARSLQQIGLTHATDLIGGFRAWKAAGLPTE